MQTTLSGGTHSTKNKGLTTITKTKVMLHDGLHVVDGWLLTVTYYDKYYHAIQSITDNHVGGQTILSSQINFTGQVIKTKETIDVGWETNTIKQVFTYDPANRLTSSTFADAGKYNTQYSYDKNGNIKTLNRMGELGASNVFDFIDNLTYGYTGNQLKYVNDQPGVNYSDNGFTDNGSFLTTNEYFYDLNGNLTQDLNKQIDHIDYNYLNLPQHIAIGTSAFNTIDYIYTAGGVKLQKSITGSGDRSTPTDYLGSMVYPGDAPAYIFTPEGRALRNGEGSFDYEYFLRDHLGNTRVSFNQKGTILQDNSYYPFGMGLGEALTYMDNSASENKYKYNCKEIQDDFGLGWYDYGARMYDAQLGRWHVVDNKAEKYFGVSQYAYAINNPIRFLDPDGNEIVDAKGNKISYTKDVGWSKNVTKDIIRIHQMMIKTSTGREQWNKAMDSPNKLRFAISQESVRDGKDLTLGNAAIPIVFDVDKNGYVKAENEVIDITIFEGSIKESVNENTVNKGMYVDDAMSCTVGHEIEHATNEENIEQKAENEMIISDIFKNDVEKVPEAVGNQIRNELKNPVSKIDPKTIKKIQ